jgi:hypothetical protein
MRWRYERDFYVGKGWTDPLMKYDFHTGLESVEIFPQRKIS